MLWRHGLLLAFTVLPSVALAEEWNEDIDLEAVPVATIHPRAHIDDNGAIDDASRAHGTPIDSSLGFPRMNEPSRGGSLAIVRMYTPGWREEHNTADWLRFFTSTLEVPTFLESCQRTTRDPSVGPRLIDSFLLTHEGAGYRYESYATWMNAGTCKGLVLDHVNVPLVPIADHAFFLYRTTCPECDAVHRDSIHLLTPPNHHMSTLAYFDRQMWTYQLEELEWSIDPGNNGHTTFELNPDDLQRWNRILDRPRATDALRIRFDTEVSKEGRLLAHVKVETIEPWLF